jgi:hypothetical protein
MAGNLDEVRKRVKVQNLQAQDPLITDVVAQASYVGLYHMKDSPSGPEWEKASIEGVMYIVKRSAAPLYHVIIKNQLGTDDLVEAPSADWDLDVHPNYLLYRTGDGLIKGWWFHDDDERKNILRELSTVLEEIKAPKAPEPAGGDALMGALLTGGAEKLSADEVMLNKAKLRSVLVEMVTSDKFLDDLLARLRAGAAADRA